MVSPTLTDLFSVNVVRSPVPLNAAAVVFVVWFTIAVLGAADISPKPLHRHQDTWHKGAAVVVCVETVTM